ncbi:MAG: HD family phosphohydrolase [Anaerolineae bacterium]
MAFSFSRDPYSLPERELTGMEKLRLLGALLVLALAMAVVLVLRGTPTPALSLEVGDISPRDIVSPRSVTYVSEVLTAKARQAAEAEVGTVYDAPDAGVTRQQVSLARQLLDRIASIRADNTTTAETKASLLANLDTITLTESSISSVLAFSENEWLRVEMEVARVLDQSMRSVIRDIDVPEVRRRIPALVSFDLSDSQVAVIVDIVSDLVQPNTLANEERTAEARRKARESVKPVATTLQAGQAIIRAGDRVTELQVEALEQIGLVQPAHDWRETASVLLSMAGIILLIYLYMVMREPDLGRDWRRLAMLSVISLAFALVARLMVSDHVLLPYVYPAAALPMLTAVLVSPTLAFIIGLLPCAFYLHLAEGAYLELAAYGLLGGLAGVLLLSRLRHLKSFIWAGAVVLVANAGTLVVFRVASGNYDAIGLASLLGAAIVNAGLAGSIAITGYLLIGGVLGSITSLQLLELSRPTQPLLRELLLKASGTYNHSLMVANMAEQAAERIGANALLARVGAYYHDIGKIARPYFYSENQQDGVNVHDRLDPRSSAAIIVGHVSEGIELARRQRLSPAIIRFIAEHHGRSRQDYFYSEAVKRHGPENVDEEAFRYLGPRPRSKETAIVMLADACEAAVRANKPANLQELSRLVERIVDDRILEGELDECSLTLHDIAGIKASFINVLQGTFHPRVQYPQGALIDQRGDAGATSQDGVVVARNADADGISVMFPVPDRRLIPSEPRGPRDRDPD